MDKGRGGRRGEGRGGGGKERQGESGIHSKHMVNPLIAQGGHMTEVQEIGDDVIAKMLLF